MEDEPPTLKTYWTQAELHRNNLENNLDTNGSTFQDSVSSAIAKYQECLKIAAQISLFSSNETIDDVSSHDLQYLLTQYRIAELLFRSIRLDRKEALLRAREELEEYLRLLDQYEVLTAEEARLLERYQENKARFSTAQTADAARRRETKIQRFKEEKALKQKLEVSYADEGGTCEDRLLIQAPILAPPTESATPRDFRRDTTPAASYGAIVRNLPNFPASRIDSTRTTNPRHGNTSPTEWHSATLGRPHPPERHRRLLRAPRPLCVLPPCQRQRRPHPLTVGTAYTTLYTTG